MACGSLHCIVCTEDGKAFAWGDNDEGQIGNDSTIACREPSVSVCICLCVLACVCGIVLGVCGVWEFQLLF